MGGKKTTLFTSNPSSDWIQVDDVLNQSGEFDPTNVTRLMQELDPEHREALHHVTAEQRQKLAEIMKRGFHDDTIQEVKNFLDQKSGENS